MSLNYFFFFHFFRVESGLEKFSLQSSVKVKIIILPSGPLCEMFKEEVDPAGTYLFVDVQHW